MECVGYALCARRKLPKETRLDGLHSDILLVFVWMQIGLRFFLRCEGIYRLVDPAFDRGVEVEQVLEQIQFRV